MKHIRNLEGLLGSLISPNSVVLDHKLSNLTEPGENYASLIRALQICERKPDGSEETIHIVAKQIPANAVLQIIFKSQTTFVKEMNVYAQVIPALVQFQKAQNMDEAMDFFPQYYGGRLNLNGSDAVDQDGVILLENLKLKGYSIWDRFSGFDLEGTEVALKTLAMFHAISLAFKQRQPDAFEKKIASRIPVVDIFEDAKEEYQNPVILKIEMFAREAADGDEKLVERARNAGRQCIEYQSKNAESIFNTVVHNDFWINNIMVKVVDGKIIDNKMVDFQFTEYSSLAKDVVFFLYSSVQMSLIESHYDQLVKFYYDNFIEVLQKLDCDVSLYTFEAFEKELALTAIRREFFHCILMTKAIYALPQNVKDLNEIRKEDMALCDTPSEGELTKAKFIIKEFAKRNWI